MNRRDYITSWIVFALIASVFFSIRTVNRSRRHQIFQTLDASLVNGIAMGDEYSKIALTKAGFWNVRPNYSARYSLPGEVPFDIQMFKDLDGSFISVYSRNDKMFAAFKTILSGETTWYLRDDVQLAKCFEAQRR